jgi:hypothetical protein
LGHPAKMLNVINLPNFRSNNIFQITNDNPEGANFRGGLISKNNLLFNLDACMNTPSVLSLSPDMRYNLLDLKRIKAG